MDAPWYLKLFFGPYPANWSTFAHNWTKWMYWPVPAAERVDVWKDRLVVEGMATVPFPTEFSGSGPNGGRRLVNLRTTWRCDTANYRVWEGSLTGYPMQNGLRDARALTWGRLDWGIRNTAMIPLPRRGFYWTGGYPGIQGDRNCCIVDPVHGTVHELIQFDPGVAAEQVFVNQAMGWGEWKDGQLVNGVSSSATGICVSGYVWTPFSKERPHALELLMADYVGCDGTLTVGVKAGARLVWPRSAAGYKAMIALGGECAVMADALAKYGCVLGDRTGYEDTGNSVVGTRPRPQGLNVQPGGQWEATNIARFVLPLEELAIVV